MPTLERAMLVGEEEEADDIGRRIAERFQQHPSN
jgi:hypothetical protein